MKKIAFTITLIFCFAVQLFAQNQKVIDSLEIVLNSAKDDKSKINTLLALANELSHNDPEKAIDYSNEALQIANMLNFKKGMGRANAELGIAFVNIGKYEEGLKYLFEGLTISQSINDKQTASHIYNIIGIVHSYQGKYAEAMNSFKAVLKMQEKINNKKEIADCYHNMGSLYERQGNFEEALKKQSIAIKIQKEIGDESGVATSLNLSGLVYRRQGNYAEAMQDHLSALKMQEEANDKAGIAYTYRNIGAVYILQGNNLEAMKNFSTAMKLYSAIKNKRGIADVYGHFGWFYAMEGNFSEAIKHTLEALKIFEEIGDKQNTALYYNNLGLLYTWQDNYKDAIKNLLTASKISVAIGDKPNIAETYESIGETYFAMNDYAAALLWLNKSLKAANDINMKKITKECYLTLSKVYEKLKDYKMAYKYHNLYTDTKELIDEESSRRVAEMKTNYETEKKDKEIQLLNKDKELRVAEIKRQTLIKNSILGGAGIVGIFSSLLILSFNRRRKTSFEKQVSVVEMNALRSQMNPHFIFNSLHSINNYMMDNDKENASEFLSKFSKLMRLILENSREQEVPLEKDLMTLELYMELEAMRFENKFSYSIEVDEDIDAENTLIPPMILQPFVENAILHGLQYKEGEGKILIRLTKENNMINCMVEDNGVGRQKAMEMKEKIATHEGESFGMKITNARIDIINKIKKAKASVTLIDLTEGLRVEVKLPLETAF